MNFKIAIKYFIISLLCKTNVSLCQTSLNFNEFLEPEGKLRFVQLDPDLRLSPYNSLTIGGYYRSQSVKNLFVSNTFLRINYRDNLTDYKVLRIKPAFNINKYLKKRRGLFVASYNSIDYIYFLNPEDGYETNSINSIGFGIGRVENISTVNQASRIFKNIPELGEIIDISATKEIFKLASELRKLDYVFLQDNRLKTIRKVDSFLSYFTSKGFDLNNTYLTSRLIDGFSSTRFRPSNYIGNIFSSSRPNPTDIHTIFRMLSTDPIGEHSFGQKIQVLLQHWKIHHPLENNLNATSIKLDLMKSFGLSNDIRVNIYSQGNYFLIPKETISMRTGVSLYYTPNARTFLGVSINHRSVTKEDDKIDSWLLNGAITYFISYNSQIRLNINIDSYEDPNYIRENLLIQFQQYFY